jgi:cobalt-zinc-cadmium efflux system outer membrane protein
MGLTQPIRIAIGFLIVVALGPRFVDAQNGRETLANPGQSGPQGLVGGVPGPSVGRTQPSRAVPSRIEFGPADPGKLRTPPLRMAQDIPLPLSPDGRPRRGIPPLQPFSGDSDGITLDTAIDILLHNSLDLEQSRGDISQADADFITASLRTNPVAYVDTQGVPYGKYTSQTDGGPNQYDFNVVYPLDLSHKRQTRMKSAWLNRQAVEAKYKDVVRLAIDNLYTAYVDALLAQRNVGFQRLKERAQSTTPATAKNSERLQNTSIFSVIDRDDADHVFEEAMRTLALKLNLPIEELKQRGLYGRVHFTRYDEPPLPPEDELVKMALANRPDLVSQRMIVARSDADIAAAQAGRFDDVLLMYQPYTFYRGIPNVAPQNTVAWALGVTVPLPIYNRQQGNIAKARTIAAQSRTQLILLEKAVDTEVRTAFRQHQFTLKATEKLTSKDELKKLTDVTPAIDDLIDRYKGNEEEELYLLMVRLKRLVSDDDDNQLTKLDEMKLQHRRSMLKLDTAVGVRILP